jgi:hypothetical protein
MKKFAVLMMISALFSVGVAYGQTQTTPQSTGDKIVDTSKKVAKSTGKGIGKGYSVGKKTVVKGTKATFGGLKKIFS